METKQKALFYQDGVKPEDLVKEYLQEIRGGKRDRVVIKGKEIKVHQVIDMLGAGHTHSDIIRLLSSITPEEIRACCAYAYLACQNEYNLYLLTDNCPSPEEAAEKK